MKTSEVTSSKCSRNERARVITGIKVDEPLPSCGANADTQPGTENFYGEVMRVCVAVW